MVHSGLDRFKIVRGLDRLTNVLTRLAGQKNKNIFLLTSTCYYLPCDTDENSILGRHTTFTWVTLEVFSGMSFYSEAGTCREFHSVLKIRLRTFLDMCVREMKMILKSHFGGKTFFFFYSIAWLQPVRSRNELLTVWR